MAGTYIDMNTTGGHFCLYCGVFVSAREIHLCFYPPADWDEKDPRLAFINGVAWWEHQRMNSSLSASDLALAQAEAEKRYPGGKLR